jgi:hypothetical protein
MHVKIIATILLEKELLKLLNLWPQKTAGIAKHVKKLRN